MPRCCRHLFGDGVRCVETEVFESTAFAADASTPATPHVLGAKYEKEFSGKTSNHCSRNTSYMLLINASA